MSGARRPSSSASGAGRPGVRDVRPQDPEGPGGAAAAPDPPGIPCARPCPIPAPARLLPACRPRAPGPPPPSAGRVPEGREGARAAFDGAAAAGGPGGSFTHLSAAAALRTRLLPLERRRGALAPCTIQPGAEEGGAGGLRRGAMAEAKPGGGEGGGGRRGDPGLPPPRRPRSGGRWEPPRRPGTGAPGPARPRSRGPRRPHACLPSALPRAAAGAMFPRQHRAGRHFRRTCGPGARHGSGTPAPPRAGPARQPPPRARSATRRNRGTPREARLEKATPRSIICVRPAGTRIHARPLSEGRCCAALSHPAASRLRTISPGLWQLPVFSASCPM